MVFIGLNIFKNICKNMVLFGKKCLQTVIITSRNLEEEGYGTESPIRGIPKKAVEHSNQTFCCLL